MMLGRRVFILGILYLELRNNGLVLTGGSFFELAEEVIVGITPEDAVVVVRRA
jgi:hypothetical protein